MHVFGCGDGERAGFELPNSEDMGRDENTPIWVQHIAFEVEDMAALASKSIESEGLEVLVR